MTDNATAPLAAAPLATAPLRVTAAVLLILGLLLPWNIHAGLGIPGTPGWVWLVLVVATAMAVTALTIPRLRLALTAPYFIVVLGFVLFAVVQAVRYGGSASIPPGVGPGAWVGVAGAVLAAAPAVKGAVVQRLAIGSLVLGVAASVFNLYWRTRFVLPGIGDPNVGTANLATAVTAVLYALVAVIPVVIGYRWLRSTHLEARLATVLLGASALVAGVLVWVLPVGRDLDAFRGIAQTTGTSGVGFEGFLAWAAAAAIIAAAAVFGTRQPAAAWRGAARKGLLLIAVWCFGTAVLRIADVTLSGVLDLPSPPYNSTALMAFDLLAAVLALWLFINSAGRRAPGRLMISLFVGLFAATVCRLVVGVALVPRVEPLGPGEPSAVFGNTLVQQITSTFDVTLAALALAAVVVAVLAPRQRVRRPVQAASAEKPASAEQTASAEKPAPAIVVPTKAAEEPAPARIVRPDA
ncbi:hypothetical protein [Mycolicibacterium sp.]|uniref:DUF7937 domain-containing protein n=1 Tax=Mycolicibacterium sp. TaxID=2320850 RepID=UPI00355CDC03